MANNSEDEADNMENITEILDKLTEELTDMYYFRNHFFENHPLEMASEKDKLVEEKKKLLVAKFEAIDVDRQVPFDQRAQFLYMKGRCYNVSSVYETQATQCLSKAVKLNPHLIDAWNELGECYWKNMNIKDAKASFEGALKHENNPLSLRCLSVILRQETAGQTPQDARQTINKSVELAKEAVSVDTKDGLSWAILGNAYLCQYFTVSQDPALLKSSLSAYKQAYNDPIAKLQPDLYYNWGIALKYEESYEEALDKFDYACRLDPPWEPPMKEKTKLLEYLRGVNDLIRTKGKIKTKKLMNMVQNIDAKMLGSYSPDQLHQIGTRRNITFEHTKLDQLQEGTNEGKVILGRVIGSIHSNNAVPFTFAIIDSSMQCVCVTVYNWADGRGTIIGDCVAIPEPKLTVHQSTSPLSKYTFKSIRINNPLVLLLNGKRMSIQQFATTRVSSTYEIH